MGESSMRVSGDLLDELYDRKRRDETYEDYIWRALDELDDLEQRVDELESGRTSTYSGVDRAAEREPEPEPEPNPSPIETDETVTDGEGGTSALESDDGTEYEDVNEKAIEAIRDADGRVGSGEIQAFVADDLDIKAKSWWRRHGRDALESAGANYIRNKGWGFE